MEKQKRAVILARVSSKSQEDEGYSLDSQLKLLKGYCDKQGLEVVYVFKIAETASKEQSRKIFHELLTFIKKNKIYHLAVEKTDRFTRNFRDAVAIDEWLEKDENRRLHAVKENLLLHKNAKSDVKFMWNIHLSVAKKYTDNLREEAMKGWAEKLAQGWLPAVPPPGYMTVTEGGKRIHVPNPETKALIQRVFKKYLEPSQTIKTITKEMELMGIRTRKGRPYGKSYVEKMLSNPFYIGTNHFNGKDYLGAQQPILSKKLFEAVQRKKHGKRPRKLTQHNPIFKGLIRCTSCGKLVTWQLQKGRYYGVCKRTTDDCKLGKMLREDALEEMTIELLDKLVCPSREIIQWVADAIRKEQKGAIEDREKWVASIHAQLERVNHMDDSLYDDKLAGEITQSKYNEKHTLFVEERKNLQEKLEKLDQSAGLRLEHTLVLLELSQRAAELYRQKSPERKRVIISKLFKELTVTKGVVNVQYTNFTEVVAEKVLLTQKIMEERK
jgi:site-specific DNA recombinase